MNVPVHLTKHVTPSCGRWNIQMPTKSVRAAERRVIEVALEWIRAKTWSEEPRTREKLYEAVTAYLRAAERRRKR